MQPFYRRTAAPAVALRFKKINCSWLPAAELLKCVRCFDVSGKDRPRILASTQKIRVTRWPCDTDE